MSQLTIKQRIGQLIQDAKAIKNDMTTNSDTYFHMDSIIDDLTMLLEGVDEPLEDKEIRLGEKDDV